MKKSKAIDLLLALKELTEEQNKVVVEKSLGEFSEIYETDADKVNKLYQLMASFYEEIAALGGEEKYRITGISWLAVELELLFASYQLCIDNGMNIIDISNSLSNEYSNIFPKTPSQLQNTYYKVVVLFYISDKTT